MKKYLTVIAVLALAVGCKNESNVQVKHGSDLNFTTEETAFTDGDLVGITIDSPVGYRNVKTTYKGGTLTPDNKLYWPVDMPDSAVTFTAYHPYTSEYNDGGTVVFAAAVDQSADADFRASDLMTSSSMASVSDPSAIFWFDHKMAKLTFYVRNDSGSEIKSVSLEAYPSVQYNMDKSSVKVTGDKVELTAHLTKTSDEGVCAYEFIFAPQRTDITITIKTDAKEYTAVLSTKTSFESGMQYSNTRLIALDADRKKAYSFALNSAQWSNEPDFVYLEPLAGGAEITEISDPGLYLMDGGLALPIYSYEIGSDQYSQISGKSKLGWRVQCLEDAKMFEISLGTSKPSQDNSYNASVRSFGLEDFESDFTTKVNVVKISDGLIWLLDENKDYGYIITAE